MAGDKSAEITVLYFAAASTATGLTVERVPLPLSAGSDGPAFPLAGLSKLLSTRHPKTTLAEVLERSTWAVNEEMIDDPATVFLRGGEEVAVICPVSGG
ncbi:hypothetical protein OBBRIDRAFT_789371 [Obba rivulosa]|uniref:MOCS2A n=1 Tax=Obba rivulosa TaxID=1052685 RepID=A0A8E2DRN9_9APHY|nr:hypothetical protein OBBRIDRAFT_789371 [Obba rivulosa]